MTCSAGIFGFLNGKLSFYNLFQDAQLVKNMASYLLSKFQVLNSPNSFAHDLKLKVHSFIVSFYPLDSMDNFIQKPPFLLETQGF